MITEEEFEKEGNTAYAVWVGPSYVLFSEREKAEQYSKLHGVKVDTVEFKNGKYHWN